MPVIPIYSKTNLNADLDGNLNIPSALRAQVFHIWDSSLGPWPHHIYRDQERSYVQNAVKRNWVWLEKALAKELGQISLDENGISLHSRQKCINFLMQTKSVHCLDIIDLSFRVINKIVRKWDSNAKRIAAISQDADDAIEELNIRFQEHRIGFKFVKELNKIVRTDSDYIQSEIVEPAIKLIRSEGWSGVEEEFVKALDYYKKSEARETIEQIHHAFESTMKAICKAKGWKVEGPEVAKNLSLTIFNNNMLTPECRDAFTSMARIGNNYGRHGQGAEKLSIPNYLPGYAIHLGASNILLLIEAYQNTK